jgi:periplasmic protein TonB
MTPLTKETIEAAGKSTESAMPRTVASAPSPERLRSEAVSLEIPIKVHGSRITEVVMGVTPHTEPFEEQSTTMIVFAQGGVLKLSTPVTTGQMMVLTNLKTRQDVICRVLKVRNNPNLQAYVEIEFTHPQPGYWGVFFPSDDSEPVARPATLSQSLNSEPSSKPEISAEASRRFAGPPSMPSVVPARPPAAAVPSNPPATSPTPASYVAPQPRPGSAFIGIGSQEEVQVAASSTLSKNARSAESIKENRGVSAPKNGPAADLDNVSLISSSPAFSKASLAESSLRAQPAIEMDPLAEIPAASTTRTFGEFGVSGNAASTREIFGSTLGVSAAGNSTGETEPRRNWILIAACAAVALVAGAGAMYFYNSSSGKAAAKSYVAPSAPVVETSQNPVQSKAADQTPYSIPAPPTGSATNDPRAAEKTTATASSKAIVTDHVESAPVERVATSVNPKAMAGAANARPVTAQRGGANTVEAPTLNAEVTSPAVGGALPAMVGSSNALPPPPPGAPARVGGTVTAPKLTTSIQPVYPPAAKQAKVEGDVVVHAIIDSEGNVSKATVISGPALLRDAALSAVKHWKYSPSLLNGEPVASDTTVTLKFRN